MPLHEIAGNIRRNQSTNRHDSKDVHHGGPIAPQPRPPPLAIQSMLKSTTELGDVGMFAQRTSRVPRSNTQSSLGLPSQSSVNAACSHRYHQEYLDPPMSHRRRPHEGATGGLRRNDTVRSSVSSYQNHSRSRRLHPRPGLYMLQQQPHLQSSSRSLHSHRSLTSLRSYNGMASHPSLSPRSYRTRHAYRSGRVPSPATSNMYEYHHPSRPHVERPGSLGTVASSPVSLMSAGRSIQGHRSEYNRSVRSFRPLPSPAVGTRSYQQRRHPSFARSITPNSGFPQNGRVDSTASLASGPTSPTASIVPFYYDYSESFHGRDPLLRSQQDPPAIPEGQEQAYQTVPASPIPAVQSPFGTMPGSKFTPVELPTRHNRRVSEASSASRHSQAASGKSSCSSAVVAGRADDEGRQQTHQNGQRQIQPRTSGAHSVDSPSGRNSTTSPRSRPSPLESTFFTNASRSPRNLSNLAAKAHSPLNEERLRDVRSIDIVAAGSRSTTPRQGDGEHEKREGTSPEDFGLPAFKFRPLSVGMSSNLRPSTSPVSPTRRTSDIVSPRPERPTSSQSRKRFSKILDVEQHHTIVETYSSGYPVANHPFNKLERVDEASSPLKTPAPAVTSNVSMGKPSNKAFHYRSVTVDNTRWSGVTSHGKSTVESLLERHIECLGLKPGQKPASTTSTRAQDSTEWAETSEEIISPKTIIVKDVADDKALHSTSPTHRPTSLSSSAQKRLMPRRLFASIDTKFPKFPLATSESDARFSLSSYDDTIRPSYGWLTLPSECDISTDAGRSKQTLLSGDYADIESGRTVKKFRLRSHSHPSVTPMPQHQNDVKPMEQPDHTNLGIPCRRSNSDLNSRDASQRRRKMRVHLKNLSHNSNNTFNSEDDTVDQEIQEYNRDLAKMGLTRVPISVVDGFAELSGESANASQQSLTSLLNSPGQSKPDTWSGVVAAIPMPGKKITGLRRKPSASTMRSVRSERRIVEPVNTSRITSKQGSRDGVPQIAHPDLGPAMRASEFDLATRYIRKSPQPETSFTGPETAESPSKYGKHSIRARWCLNGLRHIMSKSPQSRSAFTFPAAGTTVQQNVKVSQHCRVQRALSFDEQPMYPETIAMSDFAYRKHKVMEKCKEWCRIQCMRRPAAMRRRSVPASGFLVD